MMSLKELSLCFLELLGLHAAASDAFARLMLVVTRYVYASALSVCVGLFSGCVAMAVVVGPGTTSAHCLEHYDARRCRG